ncbi:MAG: hypothetical protein KDM81_08950, partial [Verrucomicrobiae bacterium]|nr:hypothetical protein [Verrucomicrobiae bacterium]
MKPLHSSRFRKGLLGLLVLALMTGSAFVQRSMNRARADLGLTRSEPLENAPPLLVFSTVVLGGFRGLIANALWIRAMEMQDEGRYFEMIQLHDWITKLTPHVDAVWVVSAWNMSYNISIKFNEPADRWRWVYAGIQLIRDQALKYNPHDVELYRELGWHFQHKLGHNLDDAHLYYKSRWAGMMTEVLGGGRPNFDDLIKPPDDTWAARAKRLHDEFKMDPEVMKEVDEEYGPLEWRLPETSAIYWACVGRKMVKTDDQLIKLRRLIFQSMQLAFYRGRLIELAWNQTVEFGPNLDIVDKASASYEEMVAAERAGGNESMAQNISNAHKNFLRDAVYFLYVHARLKEAQQWFTYLKEKYPEKVDQAQSLDDYALARIEEDAGETDQNRQISNIMGALERSFVYLATGQDDLATGNLLVARKIHARYTGEIGDGPSGERVPLPPLASMRETVLKDLLNPEKGLVPELAARLKTALG